MLSYELIFIIILSCWLYWLWQRRKFYLLTLKLPGPLGLPLFGMLFKCRRREDLLSAAAKLQEEYGSLFFTWIGPMPYLVVTEPQFVQDIFTSPHCVNKGLFYDLITNDFGPGLLSINDSNWSNHRKLLNPTFGPKVLASFMPIFNEKSDRLIRSLIEVCGKAEVDILPITKTFTLDIAIGTTMGCDVDAEKNEIDTSLTDCYDFAMASVHEMLFSPWLRFKIVRRFLGLHKTYNYAKERIVKFVENLINKKLAEEVTDDENVPISQRNIFINRAIDLLKQGAFTFQDVNHESNIIVAAAFETTANTLAYTLIMLAMHPNCQQKLFEEIVSVFPNRDNFEVTISDTQQLVYMNMVINEVMRLMAPVPLIARATSAEVQLSNGVVLPKGLQIAIDIFHMHRRQDIWGPEAHKFNPDNFLPTNLENKHPYAFVPFTKGLRNCIGWRYALLSLKVVLSKSIRNYYLTTNFQFEDLNFVGDLTIQLDKMPLLELHRRDH